MTKSRHVPVTAPAGRRAGVALAIAACWILPAALSAHGGQYRGPTAGLQPGGRPSAPVMAPGGPLTGGNANLDVSSWRVWWELNHDRFVLGDRPAAVSGGVRTSTVLPSLAQALDRTQDPDVNSAGLIAIAKAGVADSEYPVLDVIRSRMPRAHLEVREAAVLAMGISGRADAFQDLDDLVRNTARGRQLLARGNVGDRVRTFAAYALGLLASQSDDAGLKGRVLASLVSVLDDSRVTDRDVLTGVLNGIRLIAPDPTKGGAHKRVLWTAVAALTEYQERRFSDQRAAVQSHALTAIAGIVGRGDGVEQQRARELAVSLIQRPRMDAMVYRSATIALGQLLRPEDEEQIELLARRIALPPDPMVSKLGMIALGEIGGEASFHYLSRALGGTKRDLQAWAAIGLGILAFRAPEVSSANQPAGGAVDLRAEAGSLLLSSLRETRNKDVRAAIAIGLGLAGCERAAPDLRKLLEKYVALGEFAGHLCVSLALLEDRESIPLIRSAMTSADQPSLLGHAGLALARLGQQDASAIALGVLQAGARTPAQIGRLAGAAQAVGHLRNAADVTMLCQLVGSVDGKRGGSATALRAAFAAAALGSVADRDPIGFGARIAPGMNYTANTQTISNGRNGILDIF